MQSMNMELLAVIFCVFMINSGLSQDTQEQESLEVSTAQGPVRGYKASNYDVFQFFNIPYATAPTGRDKFKAPLPPPTWTTTFDAVDRRIVCPQESTINPLLTTMTIREDCLVANIHVPNTNQTNLPVLVFVHGGAFMFGWGTNDRPNGLVSSKNIVVVTFNYRLGAHGFLCLGTEEAPGNAGMKDQVALLRWVQTNIANFKGNPNDVTISGCSAGGTSVDLLLVSSMTNGLFNKVIAESGCSMNTFAVQLDPLRNARHIAQQHGFTNVTDLSALAEFYQTVPLLDLFDNMRLFSKDSYIFFQTCIEKEIGQEMFLTDAPINILRSGNFIKVPVIYGFAKHEGMLKLMVFQTDIEDMNENFSEFLPADLQFENEAQKVEVANTVKEFYFGNRSVSANTILEYIDFISDVLFLGAILRNVNVRVKAGHSEVYLYEYTFTYNGSLTIPNTGGKQGTMHCDQYAVLMDHSAPESLPDERIEIGLIMRDVIYNFITTGNPTPPGSNSSLPTWPPTGPNRSPHYSVGSTIEVAGIPTEARAQLWDDIYERYGATPQPPIEIIEDEPTTPEPSSATLNNIFSYPFWIFYTIVILRL